MYFYCSWIPSYDLHQLKPEIAGQDITSRALKKRQDGEKGRY
jgi:hypothetical protein